MRGDPNARYKIPGRQVWCYSLRSWLIRLLWIYIAMPIFAPPRLNQEAPSAPR